MSLRDLVDVSVTAETTPLSQAGFGTPMILHYTEAFVDAFRVYTSVQEAMDDFSDDAALIRCISAIFSQERTPPSVIVGRRATPSVQTIEVKVESAVEGATYSVDIISPTGEVETAEHEATAGQSAIDIAGDLETAINALAVSNLVAASTASDTVTLTAAQEAGAATRDGEMYGVRAYDDSTGRLMTYQDITPNPGTSIAADLATVQAAIDTWYAVIPTSQGKDEMIALAAAIETQRKMALVTTGDSDHLDTYTAGTSDDLIAELNALGYVRTLPLHTRRPYQYHAAGWAGKVLPKQPGAATWHMQQLRGVTVDAYNSTELANLKGRGTNYFIDTGGANVTWHGLTPGGEFIDIVRTIDWLVARISEGIAGAKIRNDKIPYTDAGITLIENIVWGVNRVGKDNGAFRDPVGTEEEFVSGPALEDVPIADRAARTLPAVKFRFFIAGAIHKTFVDGAVSV